MKHPKSVVEDFFRNFETRNYDEYGWATRYLDDLVRDDPQEALSLTLTLIDAAESDKLLAVVAAGPLEDLLTKQGTAVIDRIEEESRRNDKVRLALSGVWGIYPGDPVFERWNALIVRYGFTDGRRVPL